MATREDQINQARDFTAHRQQAYLQVFSPANNKFAEEVLRDLAQFCRANESTFHEDARKHAAGEGRREVWLRIQEHLQLSPRELYQLMGIGD